MWQPSMVTRDTCSEYYCNAADMADFAHRSNTLSLQKFKKAFLMPHLTHCGKIHSSTWKKFGILNKICWRNFINQPYCLFNTQNPKILDNGLSLARFCKVKQERCRDLHMPESHQSNLNKSRDLLTDWHGKAMIGLRPDENFNTSGEGVYLFLKNIHSYEKELLNFYEQKNSNFI